ncbi:MAG: SoxR reducing system RseC family protein [Thauera sp.]|nr:SoxR reducing system RseC family protein [Thauera sp.]
MEAMARVERIADGRLWVKVNDHGGGCGRCDEPGGCRSVQITHAFGLPRDEFSLPLVAGVEAGDRLRVSIPEGGPLRAALASYGLGVVLLLAGAALGATQGVGADADLHAAVGAVIGLVAAAAINRLLARSRWWRGSLRLEVVAEEVCVRSSPAEMRKG